MGIGGRIRGRYGRGDTSPTARSRGTMYFYSVTRGKTTYRPTLPPLAKIRLQPIGYYVERAESSRNSCFSILAVWILLLGFVYSDSLFSIASIPKSIYSGAEWILFVRGLLFGFVYSDKVSNIAGNEFCALCRFPFCRLSTQFVCREVCLLFLPLPPREAQHPKKSKIFFMCTL